MKNKSIADKISDSSRLVKSIKKNKESSRRKQVKKPLQTMTLDLEAAVNLKKAVQKLKNDLKKRKKELELQVKKLTGSRKEVKKALKKGKKVIKPKAAGPIKKESRSKKITKSKPKVPEADQLKESKP
jgi:hypothetical protein